LILNKKHSVLVFFSCYILSVALLAPYAVKLAHVFENHKHEICIDYQKTHFHEFDVDCEFYKFKINNPFTITFNDIEFNEIKELNALNFEIYSFKYYHQQLSFSLRAPPSIT